MKKLLSIISLVALSLSPLSAKEPTESFNDLLTQLRQLEVKNVLTVEEHTLATEIIFKLGDLLLAKEIKPEPQEEGEPTPSDPSPAPKK